ncbi:hypothetical protein D3C80_1719650 [compost metagenome]
MNAQNARVSQRIARDALKYGSGNAQPEPDKRTENNTRQAEFKDDQIIVLDRINPQQCTYNILNRKIEGTVGQADIDPGQGQQAKQQEQRPESAPFGLRCKRRLAHAWLPPLVFTR